MYAKGKLPEFVINGDDFDTPDGTCIRDYVHVEDLARAHVLGVKHLLNGGESKFYNLGSGKGYSNKEIVEAVRKVTGVNFEIKFGPRRAGDSPRLLASINKVKAELGWEPEYTNIEDIVKTDWEWEKKKKEL